MNYDISSSIFLDPTHDDFEEWNSVWLNIPPQPQPQSQSLTSRQVYELIQQSMYYMLSKSPVLNYGDIWEPDTIPFQYNPDHWIVQMFFVMISWFLVCEKLASQYSKNHNISEKDAYSILFNKAKENIELFVENGCPF